MKVCSQCTTQFEITGNDRAFYERMDVGEPTRCPDCRCQRRLAWRNERSLFRRQCDLCRKSIIAVYDEDTPFPVYCPECWWSDRWNPLTFGRDFDFGRLFFEQYAQLQTVVPRIAIANQNSENSEFTNYSGGNKNCYFVFGGFASECEDCLYGTCIRKCVSCVDNIHIHRCEECYECVDCFECSRLIYSQNSSSCHDSAFLFDCRGCFNCTLCAGLRNENYCLFNKRLEKDDYQKKLAQLGLNGSSGLRRLRQEFREWRKQFPVRYSWQINTENCSGDYLVNCRNCHHCFDVADAEDLKFVAHNILDSNNIYDSAYTGKTEMGYENMSWVSARYGIGCHVCWNCAEVYYSDLCLQGATNLFGCISMNSKQYCILNKQYRRDEYEKLFSQLVQHMKKSKEWGEFFPVALSPFGYNETVAHEYFPLSSEAVGKRGWKWKELATAPKDLKKVIRAQDLPETIAPVADAILDHVLLCEVSSRPYRIQKSELTFCRRMNLPLPRRHPDIRHRERLAQRNPRKLFSRACVSCQTSILSSYPPQAEEKVYCEDCYLKNVY